MIFDQLQYEPTSVPTFIGPRILGAWVHLQGGLDSGARTMGCDMADGRLKTERKSHPPASRVTHPSNLTFPTGYMHVYKSLVAAPITLAKTHLGSRWRKDR